MNGTNLCGHLVEERPGVKILVMSGADMSEIVSQKPTAIPTQAVRWKDAYSQSSGDPRRRVSSIGNNSRNRSAL
jgi:hypothetical protein